MADNVIALPGAGAIAAESPPDVIRILEEVLEKARRGEVVGFGYFTIQPNNFVGTGWATDGSKIGHTMIAGAVYLLRRVETITED